MIIEGETYSVLFVERTPMSLAQQMSVMQSMPLDVTSLMFVGHLSREGCSWLGAEWLDHHRVFKHGLCVKIGVRKTHERFLMDSRQAG